jgi:enamine deaminase RidA (YjgF/YER057c/UK114 family)
MADRRQRVSTGSPWEPIVGYSRAIRVGNVIEVAGTTAMQDGEVVGKGDAYAQTKHILTIVERALRELGGSLSDVVRTRMFVTDMSRWEEIGRAHGEAFGDVRPAATMVEVKALIDPELLVEIEVQAIVDENRGA